MKCKNHPNKRAQHLCAGCGIPLCDECAEETKPGQFYCFQCAMLSSVSAVGTSIKGKREKVAEEKVKKKVKLGAFHYFVIVAGVLILSMWGFILFGGEKAPAGTVDLAKNSRVFLFLVDSAVKRYAHYEGNVYPEKLIDLIPKYLSLGDNQAGELMGLFYQRDPEVGYRLTQANPVPGEMRIIITPKGIQYQLPPGEGA
ncbi:MAG: B-box zinc finger protein [Desulfobacteraceae bacterium]